MKKTDDNFRWFRTVCQEKEIFTRPKRIFPSKRGAPLIASIFFEFLSALSSKVARPEHTARGCSGKIRVRSLAISSQNLAQSRAERLSVSCRCHQRTSYKSVVQAYEASTIIYYPIRISFLVYRNCVGAFLYHWNYRRVMHKMSIEDIKVKKIGIYRSVATITCTNFHSYILWRI